MKMQTNEQRAAGYRELQAEFTTAGKVVLAEKAAKRAAEFEGLSNDYLAALALHNEAIAKFNEVTRRYRARLIDDAEFLTGRKAYDVATALYDAEYAAEQARGAIAEPNAIQIHLGPQGWNATYTGPHAKRIADLFDTCTLPTAFTAAAPLATVIAEVQARNPGVVVKHWNAA